MLWYTAFTSSSSSSMSTSFITFFAVSRSTGMVESGKRFSSALLVSNAQLLQLLGHAAEGGVGRQDDEAFLIADHVIRTAIDAFHLELVGIRPFRRHSRSTNSALRSKTCAKEPLVPRLPSHLLKKLRTLATVRVVLLVAVSTKMATPPGA
jgi:hypothetical protein